MINNMVVTRIVSETSFSEGDVSNALISLSNIICDALKTPKIVFTPSRRCAMPPTAWN